MAATSSRTRRAARTVFSLPLLPVTFLCFSMAAWASNSSICQSSMEDDDTTLMDFSSIDSLEKFNEKFPFLEMTQGKNNHVTFENKKGITTVERDTLDPNRIILKNGGTVSVTFLTEGAGYSSLFGYLRMKDIAHYFEYEYNPDGSIKEERLRDCDQNGIPDFHEDLYRLRSSTNKRPESNGRCKYIDPTASCPDLSNPACGTFQYFEGNGTCEVSKKDFKSSDGSIVYGSLCAYAVGQDDGELYRVPNLLEPPGPNNNYKGVGRIIYSQADYYGLGSGTNTDSANIRFYYSNKDSKDYQYRTRDNEKRHMYWRVEEMCLDGKKRVINGVERQSEWCTNRTVVSGQKGSDTLSSIRVDLMENFEPGEEIVFFLVVYGASNYVCLAPNWVTGECSWSHTGDYNVYFSKQILNSSSTQGDNKKWENGYKTMKGDGKRIYFDALQGSVNGTQGKGYGWLLNASVTTADAFVPGLKLASNLNKKNSAVLKASINSLSKKTVGNAQDIFPRFPHALSARFAWAPNYWIIGFEDQSVNGNGDWDYEDIAFIIEQTGGGSIRSDVVTGDANATSATIDTGSICKGKDCDSYSITNVLLRIKDDPSRKCLKYQSTTTCESSSECANSKISYELATDCEVWNEKEQKYIVNTTPNWRRIDKTECIDDPDDNSFKLCKVNLSLEGYTGSRLCWRAHFETQDESKCRPLLQALDLRYDMMRPGTYSRSSPSSMSNKIFYGAWELVPPKESGCTTQQMHQLNSGTCYLPSTHYQDQSYDYTARGHFVFRDLYQLNEDGESLNCSDECTDAKACASIASCWKWNGGEILAKALKDDIGTTQDPVRHLYTSTDLDAAHRILPLDRQSNNEHSKIYQEVLSLGLRDDGTYESTYNFNKDGTTSPGNDGLFLIKWLMGWEHPGATNTYPVIAESRRAWPMGAFEFSTPAIVGPPTLNPRLPVMEREFYNKYVKTYYDIEKDRPAVAYIGSSDGFVHAFDAGVFRYDKKIHDNDKALTGAFKTYDDQDAPGTGTEIFAFIPRKQLKRLANNYLHQAPMALAESSPSVADIDLGYQGKWTRNKDASDPLKNAMTALAMAAGRGSPVVFALDVTDIDYKNAKREPIPLWELDLANDKIFKTDNAENALTLEAYAQKIYPEKFSSNHGPGDKPGQQSQLKLNTNSARHSPTIARLRFASETVKNDLSSRWVAVFASDYGDGSTVGAVHLIDFATGLPVTTNKKGDAVTTKYTDTDGLISANSHELRGLYLLAEGEGVGGEIPAVDVDEDGIAEVLYVPTTQGRIYKINTEENESCVFVDLHEDLEKFAKNKQFTDLEDSSKKIEGNSIPKDHFKYQNIYSSIAVSIDSSQKVHLYVGTGNNPDNATDEADKISGIYYWLAGITDSYVRDAEPEGKGKDKKPARCKAKFNKDTEFTATPLTQGHSVWGGVASSNSGPIAVTSAEGTSADACHLKTGEGTGYIYQFDDPADLPGSAAKQGQEGGASVKATDAPVISAPIFVNGQVVAVSATAKVETIGDGNFNQPAQFDAVINMLNWQRVPSGKIAP